VQTNTTKAKLKAGQAVAGPIISEMRSVGSVKLMALGGYDFLFFDMEHGMLDWETTVSLVQMSLMCGITPIVRPTDTTYALVARAMDTGAQGVIIPRVDTREQAEAAVSYAKYPPLGRRGAGGDGRNGYERRTPLQAVEESNAEGCIILQIESKQGLDNLDEIAGVEGVDAILIGPQDLSISLGVHGDFSAPVFLEAAQHVVGTCNKHSVASGMVEKEAEAFRRWYEMGMRLLVCNSDSNMLFTAASRDSAAIKTFTS
jgi:2-dehydro-3-deoxyglucarate aldolase/4-hydroxy-2-oxoheptanedioate aldolase